MDTKNIIIASLGVLVVIVGFSFIQGSRDRSARMTKNTEHDMSQQAKSRLDNADVSSNKKIDESNCLADECVIVEGSTSTKALPAEVEDALGKAIDDEYKALATYQAIMRKFGTQRPFSMIARSEQMHIALLKSVYEKYGIEVPDNPYANGVTAPASVKQACENGVEAEIANANLYQNELLPTVEGYPDIARAFERLMNASQNRHLPAFRRCS